MDINIKYSHKMPNGNPSFWVTVMSDNSKDHRRKAASAMRKYMRETGKSGYISLINSGGTHVPGKDESRFLYSISQNKD